MLSACDLLAAPGHGVVGLEREFMVSILMSYSLEGSVELPTPTTEHAKCPAIWSSVLQVKRQVTSRDPANGRALDRWSLVSLARQGAVRAGSPPPVYKPRSTLHSHSNQLSSLCANRTKAPVTTSISPHLQHLDLRSRL